jgi:flavorubredoxin
LENSFGNLHVALNGRELDYLIIHHMEPDHCALIPRILELYPRVKVVGSQKTFGMIQQFFGLDLAERAMVVKEGDTLATGAHTLRFLMAPMVHWPEVMVTYDETSKRLFTADAFGAFGAINGNLYTDEYNVDFDCCLSYGAITPTLLVNTGARCSRCLKKSQNSRSR